MDRILLELDLPKLVILEREVHALRQKAPRRFFRATEDVELTGYDLSRVNPTIDVEQLRKGTMFVLERWHGRISSHAKKIVQAHPERPRILVIDRGDADPFYVSDRAEAKTSGRQRRCIVNHQELVAALEQRFPGTHTVLLESLPLAEQIALFSTADIVIAQHGAALANMVWMRPEARLIEIRAIPSPVKWRDHFKCLSGALGLDYTEVSHETDFSPVDVATVLSLVEAGARAAGRN